MPIFDRLAWWLSKPRNCDRVYFAVLALLAAVWWLTGEWSPLP